MVAVKTDFFENWETQFVVHRQCKNNNINSNNNNKNRQINS